MRKILDIYEQYKIMPRLANHQLKVASVASLICDNFNLPVDKKSIIEASLLHDMANVIKFDLKQSKETFKYTDEEIIEIKKIQDEFKEKYGEDEHIASCKIAEEIDSDKKVLRLIKENKFRNLCIDDDFEIKILQYADHRVSPHGIVSYEERMREAGERYKNYPHSLDEEVRLALIDCGKQIETQIFENSRIKPEDVNNESVTKYIEELKNYEI